MNNTLEESKPFTPGPDAVQAKNETADDGIQLTTKRAVEFLLSGTLKKKVCRSCLKVTPVLTSLDQVIEVANDGALYKVSVYDMIASFYPYEISRDSDLPNKICDKCLNRTINLYLFNQQFKQSDQALRSCLTDIYHSVNSLDPLQRHKFGRQKLKSNYNVIYASHKYVRDYAKPLIQLVNDALATDKITFQKYECPKCWEVLPDMSAFIRHEKQHPKNMWFRCRLCGLSFAKKMIYKRHIKTHEQISKSDDKDEGTDEKFQCKSCDKVSENYIYHLQHIEKHKFKKVVHNLLNRKANDLCTVCLEGGNKMVDIDKTVALHGGYSEVTGHHKVEYLLAQTLPDMNPKLFIGTKICEKCLDAAINSYIFKNKIIYTRYRLDQCLSRVLENLNDIKVDKNIVIEMSDNLIMPIKERDLVNDSMSDYFEKLDESKLLTEVLEDKYRIETENGELNDDVKKPKELNGIVKETDVSEFLTFKTKKLKRKMIKFTCPICNKHFVSDYFLKKHALKHANRKVVCKICSKEFNSKFFLSEHSRMTHKLRRNHVSCNKCGRAFDLKQQLLNHQKSHLTKECHICDKYFKSQHFYNSHLQRHYLRLKMSGRTKTCSFCEEQFLNKNELNVHTNKVHLQIKPYTCDMCNSKFYTERNLRSHKKLHRVISLEKCQFCDKILPSRRSLVIHVRKHMDLKPFICSVCGEGFFSDSSERKHLRRQHGGRFLCHICRTAFLTRRELKAHAGKAHIDIF